MGKEQFGKQAIEINDILEDRDTTIAWLAECIVEETAKFVAKYPVQEWPDYLKLFLVAMRKGKGGRERLGLALKSLQNLDPDSRINQTVTIEAVRLFPSQFLSNQNHFSRMIMYSSLLNILPSLFKEQPWFNKLKF